MGKERPRERRGEPIQKLITEIIEAMAGKTEELPFQVIAALATERPKNKTNHQRLFAQGFERLINISSRAIPITAIPAPE